MIFRSKYAIKILFFFKPTKVLNPKRKARRVQKNTPNNGSYKYENCNSYISSALLLLLICNHQPEIQSTRTEGTKVNTKAMSQLK